MTKMLTVVCFVFRRKAGGGSDEDADSGVLYLRGDHHPIGHTGLLQNAHTRLPPFRSAKRNNDAFIYPTQNVLQHRKAFKTQLFDDMEKGKKRPWW